MLKLLIIKVLSFSLLCFSEITAASLRVGSIAGSFEGEGGRTVKNLDCCLSERLVQLFQIVYDDGFQSDLTEHQCETHPDDELDHVSGRSYDINVPSDIIDNHDISLGQVCLSIPNAVIYRDMTRMRIDVSDPESVTVIDIPQHHRDRRRMSVRSIGVSTLLMVIVTNVQGNTQNIKDKSLLSKQVFGNSGTTISTVYNKCSAGALQFKPASGYPDQIDGGVAEITIDAVIEASTNRSVIADLVKETAAAKFGEFTNARTDINHVAFCLPEGMESWTAFSDIGGWATYYNHDWCSRSSFVAHEIGHNLNLRHSGVPFGAYQDKSCLMGKSYDIIGGPSMCFNGNKMWLLGWYADRRVEVDPGANGPWFGTIAAFVDYKKSTTASEYVLVKVGDFYLQYNRMKDFNSGVMQYGDQLTIVQYDVDRERQTSVLLKALDASTTTYTHATYGGIEITIDMCAVATRGAVDVMDISVHLSNQDSACPGAKPVPPTAMPTPFPPPSLRPMHTPPPTRSSINNCDDDPVAKFDIIVDDSGQTKNVTGASCIWLGARIATYYNIVCVKNHPGMILCPETCGVCTDTCEDNLTTQWTNIEGVLTTCKWLRERPWQWEAHCMVGSEAFDLCQETCENNCGPALISTKSPTQAPTPKVPLNGFCFSGVSTVQVKGKVGTTLMKNLRIGDEVLDASENYVPVYSFGHRDEYVEGEFLQFLPSGLEMSKDHMVAVGGRFVPASLVQLGDELESENGHPMTVESIQTVSRQGVYAPFTTSGTILVNNIKASNYVTWQASDRLMIGSWTTPLSFQWVAHMSQSPHRICRQFWLSGAAKEYTVHGMSTWVAVPHRLSLWLFEQNAAIVAVVLVPVLSVGFFSMAVEGFVSCLYISFLDLQRYDCSCRLSGTCLHKKY